MPVLVALDECSCALTKISMCAEIGRKRHVKAA